MITFSHLKKAVRLYCGRESTGIRSVDTAWTKINSKGRTDQSHLTFEIIAGKRRIRHRTTLNLNDVIFNRFSESSKSIQKFIIYFQSRSMSDPTLSDIDFKNKMA